MANQGLITLNPAVGLGPPQRVHLPLRQRDIRIVPGHTHHCAGQPRALDIMVATTGVAGMATIHNSLHCASARQCTWPLCLEYTRGDHFLVEAELAACTVATEAGLGALQMPG